MKMTVRKWAVLLLCGLLLLAFCACADTGDRFSGTLSESSGAPSAGTSEMSGTPPEESDCGLPTGDGGIGRPNIPTDAYDGIAVFDASEGVAFVRYINAGLDFCSATVAAYSLKDGTLLGVLELAEGAWNFVANGGMLYVMNGEDGSTAVYGSDLKQLRSFALEASGAAGFTMGFEVSADGRYILALGEMPALCSAVDGSNTGYGITVPMHDAQRFGDQFAVTDGNGDIGVLDPETGEWVSCGDWKKVNVNAPYLTETWSDGIIYNRLTDSRRYVIHQADPDEVIVAASENAIVTHCDGWIRIYRPDDGKYTELPCEEQLLGAAFCGTAFVFADGNGVTVLDLAKAEYRSCEVTAADENTDIHGMFEPWEGDGEEVALAERILETYGVRVIFRSNEWVQGIIGFDVSPASDGDLLPALQGIEAFLELIPSDMMRETGEGEEVWIYLCRDLTNEEGATVAGFAFKMGSHPFMAIDASVRGEALICLVAHESAHLFNLVLDNEILAGWNGLTPEGYYGENTVQYTPYASGGEVWFASSYARTNDEEDRAVTFEQLILSYLHGAGEDCFRYENVMRKARYYAAALRSSFACCADAEELVWEAFIEAAPVASAPADG